MATKGGRLTPKQEAFCREYLIDLNGAQAAIRAGYSKKTASVIAAQNLSKLIIANRISSLVAERSKKTGISAEYVLTSLHTVAERCMQAEPVMERDENGNMVPTGEWKFEHSGANRALELLGKHLSLFTEKHDHNHHGADGGPITFRVMPVTTKRA